MQECIILLDPFLWLIRLKLLPVETSYNPLTKTGDYDKISWTIDTKVVFSGVQLTASYLTNQV